MPFPEFETPVTVDSQRSWTATFDSYDQRNEDVYYLVTINDADHNTARFVVQVGLYWSGDDWSDPSFTERLQQEIHEVAVTGETNTSYTGNTYPPEKT